MIGNAHGNRPGPSKVENQIACQGELIVESTVVVGLAVPGALKAQFGT